jgi:hypothetical protein
MRRFSGHEQAEQMARFEDWFLAADKLVKSYASMGLLKEAESVVEQMKQNFSRMLTDDWRERYLCELGRRYEYLKKAPENNLPPSPAAPKSVVAVVSERDAVSDVASLRARLEYLDQDLCLAIHIFHSCLVSVAAAPSSELRRTLLAMLETKFLQMPQGSSLGCALVDLDKQLGSPLETHGVKLDRLVFESRERRNG